jgi:hypothetical protein
VWFEMRSSPKGCNTNSDKKKHNYIKHTPTMRAGAEGGAPAIGLITIRVSACSSGLGYIFQLCVLRGARRWSQAR